MDQKLFRIGMYRSPKGTQVNSVRLWLTVTGGHSVTYPENPQNMWKSPLIVTHICFLCRELTRGFSRGWPPNC